ncbi:lipoprotein-releasing system ATP-binding protein [Monaibacterium marinum]|uniref:Lipoprotein-releasing system ATP-binding protein n=1 Tax=Pontivivens marinum TaxID=1690039 RepID=A0A2C9CS06_9RHOB|nr:ABC transporter ATP-binding protein [Monaibacterium marinum]SOH94037.1 lipoprotein-releasing system ATP-binding protein [Monaibacterium marinum]
MSDPALNLTGISKTYNEGTAGEIAVLRELDLTVARGEIVGLVAPSGSGKSTLLHIAGLLDSTDHGRVTIGGQDATRLGDRARTRLRRSSIGFVYQFHHLLPEFSASENIELPQRAAGISASAARARAVELLTSVGLADRMTHRPSEMSGGEQQRVAFCRALANRPSLLLADEPTGNLDPETSEQVFAVLMNLVRETGLSAVIATHNLELAGRMDRTLRLQGGAVVPV